MIETKFNKIHGEPADYLKELVWWKHCQLELRIKNQGAVLGTYRKINKYLTVF